MLSFRRILSLVALCVLASSFARAAPKESGLMLETRDSKNKQVVQSERVASNKVGVVIVDPWNYHWCMTACERVRPWSRAGTAAWKCARRLDMVVIFAPSDVVGSYAGWPQRERALAVPLLAVPVERKMPPPASPRPIVRGALTAADLPACDRIMAGLESTPLKLFSQEPPTSSDERAEAAAEPLRTAKSRRITGNLLNHAPGIKDAIRVQIHMAVFSFRRCASILFAADPHRPFRSIPARSGCLKTSRWPSSITA